MSSTNVYDISVPSFIRSLNAMDAFFQKAVDTASSKSLDASTFPTATLHPDMRPLSFQVTIATGMAKRVAVQVAGKPEADFGSEATTMEDLQTRIKKCVAYLSELKREDFDGKDGVEVEFFGNKFSGFDFTLQVLLPNFYFHVTTAYDILRHLGIDLGKMDYLGKP